MDSFGFLAVGGHCALKTGSLISIIHRKIQDDVNTALLHITIDLRIVIEKIILTPFEMQTQSLSLDIFVFLIKMQPYHQLIFDLLNLYFDFVLLLVE